MASGPSMASRERQAYHALTASLVQSAALSGTLDQEPVTIMQPVMASLATYFRAVPWDDTGIKMCSTADWLEADLGHPSVPQESCAVFLEFANLPAACRVSGVLEAVRRNGHGGRTSHVVHDALHWACESDDGQRRRVLTFLDLLRNGFPGESFPANVGEAAVTCERQDAMSEFICALSRALDGMLDVGSFTEVWPKIRARVASGDDLASLTFTHATLRELLSGMDDPSDVLRVIASDDAPRWDVPFAVDALSWEDPLPVRSLLSEMFTEELTFLLALTRHPLCPYTNRVAPMGRGNWAHADERAKRKRDDAMYKSHSSLVHEARVALNVPAPGTFQSLVDLVCEHGLLNAAVFQRSPTWKTAEVPSEIEIAPPEINDDDEGEPAIDLTGDDSSYVRVAETATQEEMEEHPDFPKEYRAIGACDPADLTVATLPGVLHQVVDFYERHRPGVIGGPAAARLKAAIADEIGIWPDCDDLARARRELCLNRLLGAK
jgi:hypothetical protein